MGCWIQRLLILDLCLFYAFLFVLVGVELRTLCRSGTHTVNELTPPPKPSVLISGAAKKNFVILREKRQFTFCPCSIWFPGWLDGYQLISKMIILTWPSQNHTHLWTTSQTYPRWCLIRFLDILFCIMWYHLACKWIQ